AVSRVTVSVLSDESAPTYVLALLPTFAAASALTAEEERRLGEVVENLVRFTLENAYPDDDLGEIEVTLEPDEGIVRVVAHDCGRALPRAGGALGPLRGPLARVASETPSLQLLHLGSDGTRLTAEVAAGSSAAGHVGEHLADAPRHGRPRAGAPDAIEVRAG